VNAARHPESRVAVLDCGKHPDNLAYSTWHGHWTETTTHQDDEGNTHHLAVYGTGPVLDFAQYYVNGKLLKTQSWAWDYVSGGWVLRETSADIYNEGALSGKP